MGLASRRILGLASLALLAACNNVTDTRVTTTSPATPIVTAAPVTSALPPMAVIQPPTPSPQSDELSIYYARVQNDLLAQGLLRQDGGGIDTPYNARNLADNFVRVALFDEFVSDGRTLRAETTRSALRRWDGPVRFDVEFGRTVALDQRADDSRSVAAYVDRLSRVSGHPMSMDPVDPNFHVMILNEDDRLTIAPRLRELVPGIEEATTRLITALDRSTFCVVVAFGEADSFTYSRAIAVIRAEHPALMRQACIHEELAQGLGLANDSPTARPSIFNDDEEFALLTTHDELLLKILYDPRLTPGMTDLDATPIVRQIATEIMDNPV